ncbi:hypothetical protein AURDEDRAFT_170342 [Auricularia subglabra TFB-10046 SS5]|nr:hypothetical protein AURDEDRAFT_170342 [Auricularia subglabra TFB-10046 SS5]
MRAGGGRPDLRQTRELQQLHRLCRKVFDLSFRSGYDLHLSDDEFVEVLLTAHRLQFREVLLLIPRHMDTRLSAEQKLELGLQCDLDYWQLRPFQELVLSFRPRDGATNRLNDSVWMKVFAARAQLSLAHIDRITTTLSSSACGHIVAALMSSSRQILGPIWIFSSLLFLR